MSFRRLVSYSNTASVGSIKYTAHSKDTKKLKIKSFLSENVQISYSSGLCLVCKVRTLLELDVKQSQGVGKGNKYYHGLQCTAKSRP